MLRDLRLVYTAENPEKAQAAWAEFWQRWRRIYLEVVAGWDEKLGSILCFLRYPAAIRPYIRSTKLLARFIREVRRGTKVQDHRFPIPETVEKPPFGV